MNLMYILAEPDPAPQGSSEIGPSHGGLNFDRWDLAF